MQYGQQQHFLPFSQSCDTEKKITIYLTFLMINSILLPDILPENRLQWFSYSVKEKYKYMVNLMDALPLHFKIVFIFYFLREFNFYFFFLILFDCKPSSLTYTLDEVWSVGCVSRFSARLSFNQRLANVRLMVSLSRQKNRPIVARSNEPGMLPRNILPYTF